jgi:hypothetical protein
MLQKYVSIKRGDDAEFDGQKAAVFQTSIDLAGLFSSDEFRTILEQQIKQVGGSTGMSQSDLDQAMELIQILLKDFTFEMRQSIGLDDHYTHQISLSVYWPFDLNAIAGTDSGKKQPPIIIQVSFQGDLSQFNAAPLITAPENATIIPLDELNKFTQSFGIPNLSTR